MTKFHRMILRMLPGPFFGWLGTLMFLLLMQFLIRYLKDFVGKGLPLTVIIELIAYNLAYMMVLAVPMSALIATLMTFGRLAETKSYAVIKGAGISLTQLIWPVLIAGFMLTGAMWYFNNIVLPEANFRAKNLWLDIRKKKPGFELQSGVFYEGISQYKILVQDIPPGSNNLNNITVFDYTISSRERVDIKAKRGRIEPLGEQLDLVLDRGEIHRVIGGESDTPERYERLVFGRHRLRLDLADFTFERSDPKEGRRSDRTMRTGEMIRLVDSLEVSISEQRTELQQMVMKLGTDASPTRLARKEGALPSPPSTFPARPTHRVALAGLDSLSQRQVYDVALQSTRLDRTKVDNARRTLQWEVQRADRYRVEIHKKQSIALACLIFVLIGAPLGLSIRRGGLGMAAGLAVAIFLFYWVTLVQGEKLADRGLLSPWVGMWAANIVTIIGGLWLLLYVTLDLQSTPSLPHRLAHFIGRTTPMEEG